MVNTMESVFYSVLLLSHVGRLSDSLKVLLLANPAVQWFGEAKEFQEGLKLFLEYHPNIVLIDASLPNGEAWQLLNQIQISQSSSRCIVLCHSELQEQKARHENARIILKDGFTMSDLFQAMSET
jgi:DNA-binding NarL/FixJ family response regulator